jgi:hypothetical protein
MDKDDAKVLGRGLIYGLTWLVAMALLGFGVRIFLLTAGLT